MENNLRGLFNAKTILINNNNNTIQAIAGGLEVSNLFLEF